MPLSHKKKEVEKNRTFSCVFSFFFFMAENIFLQFIGIDMMKNRNWMKRAALFGVVLYCALSASAQSVCDSVAIHFHVNESELDWNFMTNRSSLEEIKEKFNREYNDTASWKLRKVEVVGSFSPEGTITKNRALAERRAETLFKFISTLCEFPDSLKSLRVVDGDWGSLVRMAEADGNLPMRQQTLKALREVVRYAPQANWLYERSIYRLKRLGGGGPYRYICDHYFPLQRHSVMYLCFIKEIRPVVVEPDTVRVEDVEPDIVVAEKEGADTLRAEEPELEELDEFTEREFHWALKTNLLYDALAIPNVGVELQLDNDWSVAANWTYAWWKKGVERRWRVYGADMAVRRWFGRKSKEKALTGHHVGIYAQALTYDFCLDEKGYMGGKPGGNLWDKLNYAVGLEYGYSMPIARRLNIDFVLGIGYWGGTYHEYRVVDHCKVWQATKNRRWFGPTKAEVSLVWLWDTSNINKKKGGAR